MSTIKAQILARLKSSLEALKAEGIRSVTREVNIEALGAARPCLQIYDGVETQVGEDTFGRTYEFPISVKLLLEGQGEALADSKDEWVGKIEDIVEADLTVNGTAVTVTDRQEVPFIQEVKAPMGGALLTWSVVYRTRRGQSSVTY